jgi:hypothetical protein
MVRPPEDPLEKFDRDLTEDERAHAVSVREEARRRQRGAKPHEPEAKKSMLKKPEVKKNRMDLASSLKGLSASALTKALEINLDMKKANTLQNPECQELIAKVLENTLFNIMQEASFGEISLEVQDKRVVDVQQLSPKQQGKKSK